MLHYLDSPVCWIVVLSLSIPSEMKDFVHYFISWYTLWRQQNTLTERLNPSSSWRSPTGDACAFDICDYVTECISLDDRTKIKIIESRISPVGNHFPTTHYKDKRRISWYSARHFKRKWLEKYDLSCYSPMNDGIYFLACNLFLAEKYSANLKKCGNHGVCY